MIIESYLRGFVGNAKEIEGLNIKNESIKNGVHSYLRTFASIPQRYAEVVYPKVGLPPPVKTKTNTSTS